MLSFLARRFAAILGTLLVVTFLLYSIAMLIPVEERAMLYFPKTNARLTPRQEKMIIDRIIREHELDKPFLIQYGSWLEDIVKGSWG